MKLKTRREFLIQSGLTAAGSLLWPHGLQSAACPSGVDVDYDFFFVQATDLHSSEIKIGALRMPHKFEGRSFVDDINALPEQPAFSVFTGDLISHTTMDTSTWKTAEAKWTRYRRLVTDRLRAPWHQIIGNNDCPTPPYKMAYPGRPMYWSFEKGGVLFVGLHGYNCWKTENTNHAGIKYDAEQLAWLKDLAISSTCRSLVLFTYEPLKDGDSHVARMQLAPIIKAFPGETIWNVCGHNHREHVASIMIGGRAVTSVETQTPVGCGFKLGDGAYRLIFCKDGRLVASSLRWLTKDGNPLRFAPSVDFLTPKSYALVEDSFPLTARATFLVGRDSADITGSIRVQDRISNYYISRPDAMTGTPGCLHLRLSDAPGARQIVLKCGKIAGKIGFSSNGEKFAERSFEANLRGNDPCAFSLPQGTRWLSLSNESNYECKFYGYALV